MNSCDAAVFRIEPIPVAPAKHWSDKRKADWARNRRFYTCNPLPGENDAAHYTGDKEKTLKADKACLKEQAALRLEYDPENIPNKSEARSVDEYVSRFNSLGVFGTNGAMTEKEYDEWVQGAKKAGGTVWTAVISFPSEQSKKIGYEDCEKLVCQTFNGFLRNAKLDPKNIAVLAAAHENTENTHIHITFYEKQPKYRNKYGEKEYRKRYTFPETVLSEYRTSITAYMDENKRDLSKYRDEVINRLRGVFTDKDLLVALKNLDVKLPKDGRLQYNAKQIEPYRKDIDDVVGMFIRRTDEGKKAHLKMLEEIGRRAKELGGTNAFNTYATRLTEEYKSRLGNVILGMVKKFRINPKKKVNDGRGKGGIGRKAAAARTRSHGYSVINSVMSMLKSGDVQADFSRELNRAEREVGQEKDDRGYKNARI